MKVGTDGVLLGAWTNIGEAEKILDVGTGTGLIAIMMAQRSSAEIHAIESEINAYQQARENIRNCPWSERIYIQHTFFQKYVCTIERPFDLIVSNPPYFINSLSPSTEDRYQARHNKSLSQEDLIRGSIDNLKTDGRLSVILPCRESYSFIDLAGQNGLYCNRKTYVKPRPYKKPKRMLLEFSFQQAEPREAYLIIEKDDRHHFTNEYRTLTRDFYLKF